MANAYCYEDSLIIDDLQSEIARLRGERDEAREAAKQLWEVAMYDSGTSSSTMLADNPWLEEER